MTRCRHCETTWTGAVIAHCGACHRTFTNPGNFDRHRGGTKDGRMVAGECNNPALAGLVLGKAGYWQQPGRDS